MSQAEASRMIGIACSHFCNILSGKKYLPPHKINAFEWTVGNQAVSSTIERFYMIRERQQTEELGRIIAAGLVRAA